MHIRKIHFLVDDYPTDSYYPFNLSRFRETPALEFRAPVTLFVGENGSGKSTLLRAITRRCGIHIWKTIETTRYEINPYEELLGHFIEVEWVNGYVPGAFFSSEMFHDFARNLDEWAAADPGTLKYFGGKSLMTQSHGQSLMSYFQARYRIEGLYLLDEPETALSPRSQLAMLDLLEREGKAGHAQFIIATHSPILLACPGATIYTFDRVPIQEVAYRDTDHYRLYRDFMKKMERKLEPDEKRG
ncbi:MAG: AAA family ATPase [Desulfobacteraceae bacterium]|jgi:predicted ATPase